MKIRSSLIVSAATIGSGMFALPYVVAQSGWLLTLAYFVILGAMIVVANGAYLMTLAAEGEKLRLLGLARKHLGAAGFWSGFIGIVIGLLLSFVIFLLLGAQLVRLLDPSLPRAIALGIFWLILSIPALVSNRRAALLEIASVSCVAAIIFFVFASSDPAAALVLTQAVSRHNLFLPFGVVLFALASWTGVEPFYESMKRRAPSHGYWLMLAMGTGIAILLYGIFAVSILGSAPHLAADTISGLIGWPVWKRDIIAALGIFAIGTAAMPVSHELRNALEGDLGWPAWPSRLLIVGLPLGVVLSGFNDFIALISLAGGLFVSLDYLLIITIARRSLILSAAQKVLMDAVAAVFLIAAVYEIAKLL